jgi:hypothetical protein
MKFLLLKNSLFFKCENDLLMSRYIESLWVCRMFHVIEFLKICFD